MAGIVLEDVWKVYPDRTQAVRELNLEILDGEFMVLVGPSGCGKTTILRMVAGLEAISRGTIKIAERAVNDMPPKDRDIAMVFQNYALYPHMTVFDNMAFGLKLQKVPRDEIQRRVKEAADILGLQDFLKRKPKALSGGQRQRVAMGRAIVRHPQAFLMDEPLSNLDAKLRVQMRSEIARIQSALRVTTMYVTHDQVEAMTMGDRVAVIKQGELQQVDSPQTLYERPSNIFVAGFIGSPAMNLLEADLFSSNGSLGARVGNVDLKLPSRLLTDRPRLREYEGRQLILGLRPEDMEDAALVPETERDGKFSAQIELREALGSDVVVHFKVPARQAITEDVEALALDAGQEALEMVKEQAEEGEANIVARLNPRTRIAKGDHAEIAVDTSRLHFFDKSDGSGIYG